MSNVYTFVDNQPIPPHYTKDGETFIVEVTDAGSYKFPELPSNGKNLRQKYRFLRILKGVVTVSDRARDSDGHWLPKVQNKPHIYELVHTRGFCFHTIGPVQIQFSKDGAEMHTRDFGGGGDESTTNPD